MENVAIARALNEVADLLDIQGANPFRVRAYRSAAQFVEGYPEPLAGLVAADADLSELPYIGKDMAGYIRELVETGRLSVLEELRAAVPQGVRDLMALEMVGPKRAAALWHELGVRSLADLEREARADHVAELRGFGQKTQERILQAVTAREPAERRVLLLEADQYARALLEHMRAAPGIDRIEVAGSWRRRKETVGDLDLLISTAGEAAPLVRHFTEWGEAARVLGAGETRAAIVLRSGLHIDLRVVEPRSFGAALCYFTGSKAHNIRLRSRAIDRGLHLSEYGVFAGGEPPEERPARPSEGEWLAGRTEEEVYTAVGLPWIPPELREDQGEIEAAEAGRLPRLIELKDIRGDLHVHSSWSNDARDSIEEMVAACEQRGYRYLALTDHSHTNGGLTGPDLERQWVEIAEVAERHPGIRILRGIEVAILRDGSLDLPDEYLAGLDWVIASVHSYFRLDAAEQTRRVTRAMEHPAVRVLGHPTTRLLNERPPVEVDMEAVLRCAAEHGVAVELDAQPMRLDLPDVHLRRARELGVKVALGSDAHTSEGLAVMRYGVDQARRAGLERGDVLNTLPPARFLRLLRKAR